MSVDISCRNKRYTAGAEIDHLTEDDAVSVFYPVDPPVYGEEEETGEPGYQCPVCGKYYFKYEDSFEICPCCGWENDYLQAVYPDEEGGANEMSLNQAREAYRNGRPVR